MADSTASSYSRILEPFQYLCEIPGKDVRGSLIDCFQEWLRIPEETIHVIKDIIASLHNASLLVDDIEDNSKLRRGVPVAHSIFGIATTINCANLVYFLALEKCHSLKSSLAMEVFVKEMINLHKGQGLDIYYRDHSQCPTEEAYKAMVLDKTGGLFRLAVGLMQAFSENRDTNFTPLLNLLGLYFQIRDDYLNISSDSYMQTKSYCEDITEGKYSFPIIHAIQSHPNDSRLINILRQRTEDMDVKRHAVHWMQQCGSLVYTRTCLLKLRDEILAEIVELGGHASLQALMTHLDGQLDEDQQPGQGLGQGGQGDHSQQGFGGAINGSRNGFGKKMFYQSSAQNINAREKSADVL